VCRWIISCARRTRQISHRPCERRRSCATTARGTYRQRLPAVGPRRRAGNGRRSGSCRASHDSDSRRSTSPSGSVRGWPRDISRRERWNASRPCVVTWKVSASVGAPCRASSTAFSACRRSSRGATPKAFATQDARAAGVSESVRSRSTRPTASALSTGTRPLRTGFTSSGAACSARPSENSRLASRGPSPCARANACADAYPERTYERFRSTSTDARARRRKPRRAATSASGAGSTSRLRRSVRTRMDLASLRTPPTRSGARNEP